MLKYRLHLFARHTWKPREKIFHPGSILQVLKKRPHRNTGSLKDPGAADPVRVALDRGTLAPIDHTLTVASCGSMGKSLHAMQSFVVGEIPCNPCPAWPVRDLFGPRVVRNIRCARVLSMHFLP